MTWTNCLTNSQVANDLKRHNAYVTSLEWSQDFSRSLYLRLGAELRHQLNLPSSMFHNPILSFLFQVPANLARRFPHLAHVEKRKLNRPNFEELDKIWGPNRFDWRQNYALHTWYRIWKDMSPYYNGIEPDPETIKTMNHTFGEIARTIYYGQPELMVGNSIWF